MIVEPRLDHVGQDAAHRVAKGVMVVGEQLAVGGVNHLEGFLAVRGVTRGIGFVALSREFVTLSE